jgi:hypothetical protein
MATGLGSLGGTLNAQQLITQAEALRQQQEQELARRANDAAQAAHTAQSAYQTAAAAPPLQINPAELFIPGLLANIASVIAADPSYRERAQEGIRQRQRELAEARAQNLTALRDAAAQKAELAQHAGDLETQTKWRNQIERLDKQLDQLNLRQQNALALETLRHEHRLGELTLRGEQQQQTIAARAQLPNPAERSAAVRQGINPDSGLLLSGVAMREVTRRLALAKRGDEKSRNEALNGVLEVATQRWDSDKDERAMGLRLLRLQHPFYKATPDQARYAVTGERIFKKVGGRWVRDPATERNAKAVINELVAPWFAAAIP